MGSTPTWPTNLILYTRGSKGPLIRAILDHFSLFWHILHHTDWSTHQNVGLFRQEPPQTMGSAQPWPINLSFYTIGSNRPLIRAIFDNFSLFWHSLHHTDQSIHQEVDLFGQEHPQTVGATQPWSINPSFNTIGSKGRLIRTISFVNRERFRQGLKSVEEDTTLEGNKICFASERRRSFAGLYSYT